jgi:ABC-2 type transport system ATP-binding protein
VNEAVIETRGMRKSYGAIEALRGIDLRVTRGEVFALIGPNGAGKTTAVEILEGFRDRDSGTVTVLGDDPAGAGRALKERIGIVLQETSVEPYLTVEEIVELFRGYYANPLPLDQIIEMVGLQDKRSSLVRRLSGGQQRRLDVAIGLAGDPELLFLDEPTTGFDPQARRVAWEMILGLKSHGKTIFLTTHYMAEAEALSDRVAIIDGGRIVAEGAPHELMSQESSTRIMFRPPTQQIPEHLGAVGKNGSIVIDTAEPTAALYELTTWAVERNVSLEGLTVSPTTLEDVYLSLVGDVDERAVEP